MNNLAEQKSLHINYARFGILKKYRSSGRPHWGLPLCVWAKRGSRTVGSRKSAVETGEVETKEERPLNRYQCRRYLERTVTSEFRKIVQGFVREAKKGGCAHMKMATELVDPGKKGTRRGKGSVQRLLEKIGE